MEPRFHISTIREDIVSLIGQFSLVQISITEVEDDIVIRGQRTTATLPGAGRSQPCLPRRMPAGGANTSHRAHRFGDGVERPRCKPRPCPTMRAGAKQHRGRVLSQSVCSSLFYFCWPMPWSLGILQRFIDRLRNISAKRRRQLKMLDLDMPL